MTAVWAAISTFDRSFRMTEASAAKPNRACAYSKADNVAATNFVLIALLLSSLDDWIFDVADGGRQASSTAGMSTAPIEPLTKASLGAANSAIAERAIVTTATCNNHLTIR